MIFFYRISKSIRLSVGEFQKTQNVQQENFPREKSFVDKVLLDSLLKENVNGEIPTDVRRKVDELQAFIAEPFEDETNFPQRVTAIKVCFLFCNNIIMQLVHVLIVIY